MPLQAPPPAFPKKPKDKEEAYTVPVLPSGTPIVGFDSYPTIPQTPPSEPTKFPYGHALGPSIYTQAPTAIDLRTRMGGENAPYGFGQPSGFATLNPAPSTRYIPFGGGGRTSISPEGVPVNVYPSRTDITGMNGGISALSLTPSTTPFVSAENPMLAANPQGFTPFTPFSERMAPLPSAMPLAQTMDIEGGPVSLTGATAMTSPKTAEQQGRVASALRTGTVYATPEQLANLNSGVGGFSGQRTPAEQQALLAQVRANGAKLAAKQTMRNFAESRIPEGARVNLPAPQGRYGQPLTDLFPSRTQFSALPQSRGFIGSTGFGEMQRQQTESASSALRPSPLYAGMGIGAIGGGPQPAQPMVANNNAPERQRSRLFGKSLIYG